MSCTTRSRDGRFRSLSGRLTSVPKRRSMPSVVRARVESRAQGLLTQPPTFIDEQRESDVALHSNLKVGMGFDPGFTPRSTNASVQPRTH